MEYLKEPLILSLRDQDPYVWKAGVLSIAKLYNTNPNYVKEEKLIEMLQICLKDPNLMVITNAIKSL